MSLRGFSRIQRHLDIFFFYNDARTQFHENLTYCLVADTRSYTCGLVDKHCFHTGCSFLLHNECLISCCMWQKTNDRNRCIVQRRKATNLQPEVLAAQTEHHTNLWMTDEGKNWSVSAFQRKAVLSKSKKINLCAQSLMWWVQILNTVHIWIQHHALQVWSKYLPELLLVKESS